MGMNYNLMLLAVTAPVLTDPSPVNREADFPLVIESTAMIRDLDPHDAVVARVRVLSDIGQQAELHIALPDGTPVYQGRVAGAGSDAAFYVDVPIRVGKESVEIRAVLKAGAKPHVKRFTLTMPDDDWVMHFIPGFHYDPVWWNTQAHYTETGYRMGDTVGPGLTLVESYLRKCFEDRDYTVALHQLPYLKTYLEAHPDRFADLMSRIPEGHCSFVGGTYNELSTTLISAEATARNAVYGTVFQREILNGHGAVWWQCDVFGHDPSFPSLMRRAGHEAGAFARGPFHQWGAPRDKVNFPSEFIWMAPDGESVLTHYMTGHYGYAYSQLATGMNRAPEDPREAEKIVAEMFEDLRRPALTHHVLFPMHMDFIRPLENMGDVVRHWNAQFVSPKALMSTPEWFFASVREAVEREDLHLPVITRDMNPIYTGCQVSYADLKTANREVENTLRSAEVLATLAALEGMAYPSLSIDRAWRQLLFNAHHDGITGSMSDQVYLDIMYAYHDALDLANDVRDQAAQYLTNIHGPPARPGATEFTHWNTLASPRRELDFAGPGPSMLTLPSVGYVVTSSDEAFELETRTRIGPTTLENAFLRAEIDLKRGGTLVSLFDKAGGVELLRGPANDVVILDEYDVLPGHGEGPWHISPTGRRTPGTGVIARLVAGAGSLDRHAIVVEADYEGFVKRQTYLLPPQKKRLDITTQIKRWRGENKLLRVEFPFNIEGALPVYQTAAAVIGRPFSRTVDTAQDSWTLDQAFHKWFGLGRVCSIDVLDGSSVVHRRAIGVGEIIIPDDASKAVQEHADGLAEAFVKSGVTTTITRRAGRRYGDLEFDSNVPDFRVELCPPNSACAGAEGRKVDGETAYFYDNDEGLPRLVLHGEDAVNGVINQLKSENRMAIPAAFARVEQASVGADRGVAITSNGPLSAHVSEDGTISLNLMRSCTSWPAGVWIDPPARRLPDGLPLQTMHGSHRFSYSVVPHRGTFRNAQLSRTAEEFNSPIVTVRRDGTRANSKRLAGAPGNLNGDARPSFSFLAIEPPDVVLAAMKPVGYAEARWNPAISGVTGIGKDKVALRVWNGTGRPVTARIRFSYLDRLAWRANLLEEEIEALTVEDQTILVPMRANAYETVICQVSPGSSQILEESRAARNAVEASVSTYWLENRAEGTTGNGLVSISAPAREVALVDDKATTSMLVVNHHTTERIAFDLKLDCSPGLRARLSKSRVELNAGEFKNVQLSVARLPSSSVKHRSYVRVIGEGPLPWTIEGGVWIVDQDSSVEPGRPLPVEIINDMPVVDASEPEAVIAARIVNHSDGPVHGEAAWLGPRVSWAMTPWRQPITIPARASVPIHAVLNEPMDSQVFLRFTFAGKTAYGPAIALTTRPADVIQRFDVQRLRLQDGQPSTLQLTAISVSGLSESCPVELELPPGWSATVLNRHFEVLNKSQRLVIEYGIAPSGDSREGLIHARVAGSRSVPLPARVVPVQRAARVAGRVAIDGMIDEWADHEFTRAESDLGSMRTAVRYGSRGLALAIEVHDEEFSQQYAGGGIWQGDSIQFGLSTKPSTTLGYQDSDFEYGAGLTSTGPIVWSWIAGTGGRTGLVDEAQIVVNPGADGIVYEIFMPSSILSPVLLEGGTTLGFSYIANDNDGDGFRGAIQWTGGLSGSKDPSLFGELYLVP
jgi:alpha-mannosidase